MKKLTKTFFTSNNSDVLRLSFEYDREHDETSNVKLVVFDKISKFDLTDLFLENEELSAILDTMIDDTIQAQ